MAVWVSKMLLTLVYSAELWPLTAAPMKWLDAAHHIRWQRKHISCLWERHGNKWRSQDKNWTTKDRGHTQRTRLHWLVMWYRWITTPSIILGGSRIQERTRSAKDKLERHCQEKLTKIGTRMGRGRGSGPWQTRMASECGLVFTRTLVESRQQNCPPHLLMSCFFTTMKCSICQCVADCCFSVSDKMFDPMYMMCKSNLQL